MSQKTWHVSRKCRSVQTILQVEYYLLPWHPNGVGSAALVSNQGVTTESYTENYEAMLLTLLITTPLHMRSWDFKQRSRSNQTKDGQCGQTYRTGLAVKTHWVKWNTIAWVQSKDTACRAARPGSRLGPCVQRKIETPRTYLHTVKHSVVRVSLRRCKGWRLKMAIHVFQEKPLDPPR